MPDKVRKDILKRKHFDYDIFISHNRADKEWARELADRLAAERYNGRPLRPWLDEQFLDPGKLESKSELTTAMDRSRFLGLVMSPEAVASKWVDFELKYFLGARDSESLIPILRQTCLAPKDVRDWPLFDFRNDDDYEDRLKEVIAKLCPPSEVGPDDVAQNLDRAFAQVEKSDPGGFAAKPTKQRNDFFSELTRHDVDVSASEGLAIAAFERAAEHILRISKQGAPVTYNCKMLLGECLAAALHHSVNYRQVAQRYLDIAGKHSDNTALLFVVARAYSKLAEIDIRMLDTSVLLRMISQLDAKPQLDNQEQTIELLLGRTVGKIRETAVGEFMIKFLSEGGRTSRIITAVAIAFCHKRASSVFYISELERLHEIRSQKQLSPTDPPSRKLLSLYSGLDLYQDESVAIEVQKAKRDIEIDYPGSEFPYGYFWFEVREGIIVTNLHNAPFMGTIVKATLKNMDQLADNLDMSRVACLTEPRIVDSLFNDCGALLILEQDPNSHQCRRLRDRGVPFGMLSHEMMTKLTDGKHIIVDQKQVIIWDEKK
jgi:hypothetical protein